MDELTEEFDMTDPTEREALALEMHRTPDHPGGYGWQAYLPMADRVLAAGFRRVRSDRRGWFADLDESATDDFRWAPHLQADGVIPSLDIWFRTEDECMDWIRENVIGRGLFDA
jgi:hypothetical protein